MLVSALTLGFLLELELGFLLELELEFLLELELGLREHNTNHNLQSIHHSHYTLSHNFHQFHRIPQQNNNKYHNHLIL